MGRTNTNGANTPISNTYPIEYGKALDDAEKREQALKLQRRLGILAETNELLSNATTAEQRTNILNQQLGQLGDDFEGRLQLQRQYGALVMTQIKWLRSRI